MTDAPNSDRLKSYFLRLKALDEEIAALRGDMAEVRAEAKADGFDPPTLTRMIMRARKDPETVMEADALLETYEAAVGSGAATAGTLDMKQNAEGFFEAKMVTGGEGNEVKLSKAVQARRDAMALAEMAERARQS